MAKETEISLDDDVNVIREILFGDQLKTVQQKIKQLENSLAAAQKENQQLHQALDAEIEARQRSVKDAHAKLGAALDDQSTEFRKSLKNLDRKLTRNTNQLKKQTNETFANHDALHEDLVKMLALSLLKYQHDADEAPHQD